MAGSPGSAAETRTIHGNNAGNSGPPEGHRCHYRGAERAAGTEPSPAAHSAASVCPHVPGTGCCQQEINLSVIEKIHSFYLDA